MMKLDEGSIWSPTKSDPESSNLLFLNKTFLSINFNYNVAHWLKSPRGPGVLTDDEVHHLLSLRYPPRPGQQKCATILSITLSNESIMIAIRIVHPSSSNFVR
jgi:hypothetical protein